jgi:monoterpene epsilon-lactone hydrolase
MSDTDQSRQYIPPSVSAEAAAILRMIGAAIDAMPPREPPSTLADFDAANARGAAFAAQISAAPLSALQPTIETWDADGVPVVTVRPREARAGAAAIAYVHGGGFTGGSAQANILTAAVAAATSGRVVHSIDYTLAPRATWRDILDEVARAWTVIRDRHGPLGLVGDSAGGCIVAAATLLLRERNEALPAALVLLSPVTDLAGGGDTNATLAAVDYLERRMLEPSLRAYADPADWDRPLVSPVHADFSPGFPPVLTQVGTREILLSDAVRLHRALMAAGSQSRLEVYEGMPHVFQPILFETPEGKAAWAEIASFWSEHLA